MLSVRRARTLRLLAVALVLWLAGDVVSHAACPHDLLPLAAGRSDVGPDAVPGTGTPTDHSTDREDVNHCACHWQFLAAPVFHLQLCGTSAPLASYASATSPQVPARRLERPPQHPAVAA